MIIKKVKRNRKEEKIIGLQMKIYNNSPIWLQNIFTSIKGYVYKKQRYGSHYHSYLEELRKRKHSNCIEQKRYQNKQFIELINYAVEESPFYKTFYSDLDISSVKNVQDIKKIPLLYKQKVRKNIECLYTISEDKGVISNTSGTTGTPMKFIHTKKDLEKRMAYLDYFKEQHGFISMKMKRASFNSSRIIPSKQKSKIFWRDNLSIKQRIYSGYHCKGDNLHYYVRNLNKYKPESLDGYPSSLYELARYIINKEIVLTFKPIAVFPTAETLLPYYKKTIEKAFNCPVRDQYASSEGAPFITECKYGRLHYNIDTGVIEVNENGDMIVTCFQTHGTPLIRYMIGDKIVMDESNLKCECGSCHPIVKRIEGRGLDYLQTLSNGKFTEVYVSLVSEEFMNSVKNMQFVQNKINEIEVYLEIDKNYEAEMNKIIINKLKLSLGNDMNFKIKLVDEITKESSGKYKLIKNNL